MKQVAAILIATLASSVFACAPAPRTSPTSSEADRLNSLVALPHQSASGFCVLHFEPRHNASFSEVADLVAGMELQVCGWEAPTRLLAFKLTSPSDCEALATPEALAKSNVQISQAISSVQPPDVPSSCGMIRGRQPTAEEIPDAVSLCFVAEPARDPNYNMPSIDAITFGLQNAGVPVSFATVQNGRARLWIDVKNYPWPADLNESLQYVAGRVGVVATSVTCQ